MNKTLNLMVMIASAMVSFAAVAADGTWNGIQDALWSNANNWTGGIPGTGDTVTFNNAGNDNTTIDLGAGVTISNVLFDTASAAAYTIGSGTVGSQTLTLNHGSVLTVNAAVANPQTINAAIKLGHTAANGTFSIVNNSANLLKVDGTITAPSGGTTYKTLTFDAAGEIVVNGNIVKSNYALCLVKKGTATLFLNGTTTLNHNSIIVDLQTSSIIDLGTTGRLSISAMYGNKKFINAASDAEIKGGTVELTNFSSGNDINVVTGTLTISSLVTGLGNYDLTGAGTLVLTHPGYSNTGNITLGKLVLAPVTNNTDMTVTGAISGSGPLTIGNAASKGRVVLAGNNTYSGGTSITNCALLINGAKSGTGTVNVYSGGTLGGTGTVVGALSVLAGGTLAGGGTNGLGTLRLSGNVTWNEGATNYVRVVGFSEGQYGSIQSTAGTLNLNNAILFVDDTGLTGTGEVVIAKATDTASLTGQFSGGVVGSNKKWIVTYTTGMVTLKAIPAGTIVKFM